MIRTALLKHPIRWQVQADAWSYSQAMDASNAVGSWEASLERLGVKRAERAVSSSSCICMYVCSAINSKVCFHLDETWVRLLSGSWNPWSVIFSPRYLRQLQVGAPEWLLVSCVHPPVAGVRHLFSRTRAPPWAPPGG